ncbi:MAG: hypothetical protein ACRCW9_08900 [Cetobacterium sp.]
MTLKKEIGFDFVITILLWQIYSRNAGKEPSVFALNSFLFGAPYFLAMIKGLFLNNNSNITAGEMIFLLYSGSLLICSFFTMVGGSSVIYIGIGNTGDYQISHSIFSLLLLPLGSFPLFKIF